MELNALKSYCYLECQFSLESSENNLFHNELDETDSSYIELDTFFTRDIVVFANSFSLIATL